MREIVERIVKSEGYPNKDELWLNPSTSELKHYGNGEWQNIHGDSGYEPTPSIMVEGNISDYYFSPIDGQPTFGDARNCYLAGGVVRIKIVFHFDEGDAPMILSITGYYAEPDRDMELFIIPVPTVFNLPNNELTYYIWRK